MRQRSLASLALTCCTLTLCCLAACAAEGDRAATDKAANDEGDLIFDPATLIEVEIELAPADWDLVRNDKRDFSGFDTNCPPGPYPDTYTWRPAAKVRVQGRQAVNVGVRKKGLIGSVSNVKPSLKLKFDKFEPDQRLFGRTRMTLNNNVQDGSHMVQCLTYDLARKFGVAAPRCNYARVTVNGQLLGIYSHIEPIKEAFLEASYGNGEGHLYEGTVADFRDKWLTTFEVKNERTDPTKAPLKAIADALLVGDDQLMAAVGALVDIDDFNRFWALNLIVHNADSYFTKGNNFYVYFDPGSGGRARFIPWGADAAFRTGKGDYLTSNLARPALARRLYLHSEGRKRFLATLAELLDKGWDEAHLLAEVDRMEQLVGQTARAVANPGSKVGGTVDFDAAVATVRSVIGSHRAAAQAIVDAPPEWTEPLLDWRCNGGGGGGKGDGGKGGVDDPAACYEDCVGKGKDAAACKGYCYGSKS